MSIATWTKGLFDRGFDPETARRLPQLDPESQSNVPGLYMVGEIAGTPLIKLLDARDGWNYLANSITLHGAGGQA